MILVRKVLTADETNILSGTELQSIPTDGNLEIYAASSQSDTNMTIFRPGGEVIIFNRPITQRTGGVVDTISDTPYELPVTAGESPRIDIDINTAASVAIEIQYRALGEE